MRPLIVANWKCNPTTLQDAKRLFNLVRKGIHPVKSRKTGISPKAKLFNRVKNIKKAEVVICPPFVYLPILQVSAFAKGFGGLAFGSQNCFSEKKGPFTGEISPFMLKNLGCEYVIIGHSERRRHFGETNEMINKKLKLSLAAKLKPVFCVGESQAEKTAGQTQAILQAQIREGLKKISKKEIKNIVIAYEPIWAIGTGSPCDIEEAQKMGLVIRKIITSLYNQSTARDFQILYGGSVDSKNAAFYVKEARFQGLLVGGASLNAQEFIKIVKNVI